MAWRGSGGDDCDKGEGEKEDGGSCFSGSVDRVSDTHTSTDTNARARFGLSRSSKEASLERVSTSTRRARAQNAKWNAPLYAVRRAFGYPFALRDLDPSRAADYSALCSASGGQLR